MLKADAAIIGAGPAGSVAAFHLAQKGAKVILIERSAFPREKSCGDGVSAQGILSLEKMGLKEWANNFPAMDRLLLSSPGGQKLDILLQPFGPFSYGRVIPRIELDERLAHSAVDAGVQLLEHSRVEDIEVTASGVCINVNGSPAVEAQMAILADGSHAPITRKLGFLNESPDMYAMRQYVEGDQGPINRIEIHFQKWIIPGYNWIFPCGNGSANVGTGTYAWRLKKGKVDLRQEIQRFMQDSSTSERLSNAKTIGTASSHPLRTRLAAVRTHADRLLVAGDAAGLICPMSGEGISQAMISGELAAHQALYALEKGSFSPETLANYSRQLRTHFMADQRAARLLRLALNYPALLNTAFKRLAKNPNAALFFARVIVGQIPASTVFKPAAVLKMLS